MNNEAILRAKVWEILNTIQANQLYVHSSVMEFKVNTTGMNTENIPVLNHNDDFISKIRKYFKSNKLSIDEGQDKEDNPGKKSKKKTTKTPLNEQLPYNCPKFLL